MAKNNSSKGNSGNTNGGTETSFTKTPQARDDAFGTPQSGKLDFIDTIYMLDVMANDLAGKAKSLWSVDDGINDSGAMSGYEAGDLLTQDVAEVTTIPSNRSLFGASLSVTADGRVAYDVATIDSGVAEELTELALGETMIDSFIYAIRMANGTLSWGKATVVLTGVNDTPTVQNVALGAVEDAGSVNGNFVGDDVDSDDDGSTLTYSIIGAPALGTLTNNGLSFSYDPGSNFQSLAAGETIDFNLAFTATDSHGAVSDPADLKITVTGVNDAPTLAAGSVGANEDGGSVNVDLSALGADIDSDNDGNNLTYSLLNAAAAGSASITGTSLTFSPGSDFQSLAASQTQSFDLQVQAEDAHGATATNNVTVTVTGVNDAPEVQDVSVIALEDGGAVVGNFDGDDIDSDDDGNSITYDIIGTPGVGALTNNGDGSFSYDPGANFQSLAQGEIQNIDLTYTATDSHSTVSTAGALTITVTGVNDAPTLAASSIDATEDGPSVSVDLSALGADIDSDDDGTSLTYAVLSTPPGGAATINGTTLEFAPGSDFQSLAVGATTSFDLDVEATDSHGAKATSKITVTITGVNDAPDAVDDNASLTALSAPAPTSVVHWVDWTSASIESTTPGRNPVYTVSGTITLPDKTIGVTYHGQLVGYQLAGGTDYYVTSNGLTIISTEGVGVFTSAEVANGPTNNDILQLFHADSPRNLTFSEPVDNLFFAIVSMNANGYLFDQDFRIVSSADGVNDLGYFGYTNSYTKTDLGDGRFGISTPSSTPNEFHGVLAIENAVNSLTWTSQSHEYWNGFTVGTYGAASTATVAGNVLDNDTDIDNDALTVVSADGQAIVGNSVTLTLGSGATVNVNKDGSYLYDENGAYTYLGQDEQAEDSFTYTISDGNGGTDTATVTINVTGINDAPVITGGDSSGAVTVASGQGRFNVEQWTAYSGSFSLASLQAHAASQAANYTATTTVIDFTDDPGGFSGEIPGSTPWPAAVATSASGTGGINNSFFARITASVLITQADTYTFRTFNDDGVYLRVNNQLIINDPTQHPEAAYEGSIALTPGVYPLELFFFENGGEASLELSFKNSSGIFQHVTSADVHDSGTLQFSDVDLTDTHTVNVAPVGSVSGNLTATVTSDTTGSGTGGNVDWNYSVGVLDYQYLGAGATAVESFTVSVDDGKGGTAQQQVDITITGVNDAPVANPDTATVNEDSSVTISVLANDTDPDVGDTLSLQSAANGQHGTVTIAGSNVIYTPSANFFGNDSFSYVMQDAAGVTSTASVNVTVNPVNDGPNISFQGLNIANPSFETGNSSGTAPSGWTTSQINYIGDWEAADGTRTLDMNAESGGGYVEQTLQTIIGAEYTVGFALSKNPGSPSPGELETLHVSVNGSTPQPYEYTENNAANDMLWSHHTFTFIATSTSTTLRFASADPTGGTDAWGPALDNISAVAAAAGQGTAINGLVITDIDSGASPIQLNISVENGSLNFSGLGLTAVDGDGSDGTLSFTGSLSAINAALINGLVYTSNPEFDGLETLTAVVYDLGATGGGSLTDTQEVYIQVIGAAPILS